MVMEDASNKTINFHNLDRSTEEVMSTFQSLVEAEQRNGGPIKKRSLAENGVKQGTENGEMHQDT